MSVISGPGVGAFGNETLNPQARVANARIKTNEMILTFMRVLLQGDIRRTLMLVADIIIKHKGHEGKTYA